MVAKTRQTGRPFWILLKERCLLEETRLYFHRLKWCSWFKPIKKWRKWQIKMNENRWWSAWRECVGHSTDQVRGASSDDFFVWWSFSSTEKRHGKPLGVKNDQFHFWSCSRLFFFQTFSLSSSELLIESFSIEKRLVGFQFRASLESNNNNRNNLFWFCFFFYWRIVPC